MEPPRPSEHEPQPPAERARRPWGVRLLRGAAIALTVLAVLVVVLLLVLRTEWARVRVQSIALQQIQNLLDEGAEASAERIDGTFLTGARMIGFEITQAGETSIHIDTLTIRYDLLTLLRRTFSASEVYAGGVGVFARQAADSTWNLARILKPAPEPEVPADTVEASRWSVLLDDVLLRRGTVEVHFWDEGRDSVLVVDGLHLAITDFASRPEGLEATLDSLVAVATPAARPKPVALFAAGSFTDEHAEIRGLSLQSDETDLRASGLFRYGEDEPFTFDADLQAAPLSFADVRAFAPVPLYGTATIRLQAQGTTEDILARLNAELEDGGMVDLSGTFSADTTGPVRYAAQGDIARLNLATLLGDPAFASDLNAALDIDLAGPRIEQIDGTVDLQVRGSSYGEQRIQRADLAGTFSAGRLRFTLGAALPGARLLAQGNARPFDDVPTYNVEGEVAEIDLAALLDDPGQSGRFAGTFGIEGRGFDTETALATASVRLTEATYEDLDVEDAWMTARLRRGLVAFDLEADLGGAGNLVQATGSVRPFDDVITYAVEQGRVQHLNLAAFAETEPTDLTGAFALEGRGLPPEGALHVDARLRDSRLGTLAIAAAGLDATLERGALSFSASADLADAGRLSALGSARPFDEPLTYTAHGWAEHLNLAALLDDPGQESDLSGAFEATGTGTDPEALAADFRLDLEPSRYRQQQITAGSLAGSLAGGALDAHLVAATPEGRLAADLAGRPFDETPTLALSNGTFRGLNLALLLDDPSLQTSLSGRLALDARGFDPQVATMRGALTFSPSTINRAELRGGTVALDLVRGRLQAEADLGFEQGAAHLAFSGRPFDETPTYEAEGDLEELNLAALLSPDAARPALVDLTFEIEGRGFDPRTATIAATASGHAVLPGATVDTLDVRARLAEAVLDVEDFRLRSDIADASAEGAIALYEAAATRSTDLAFEARVKDVEPLNAYLSEPLTLESGSVSGRAYGPAGRPLRFDVRAEADQFAYGETRASRLEAELSGEYLLRPPPADTLARPGPLARFRGSARLRFGYLAAAGLTIEEGDVDALYDGDEIVAEGAVAIDRARDFTFRLRTDLQPEAQRAVLETFRFNVGDETWELLQEATVSYGERIRVRNLLLHSGRQQIAADGVIDLEGEQNFVITIEEVEVDPFADLVGYEGVGGELTATLVLSGPAAEPHIEGEVRIDSLETRGELVGALSVGLAYDSLRLSLEALLTHVSGQTLTAEGFLPLDVRLAGDGEALPPGAPVHLVVRADSFPVAWVEPFLPEEAVSEIGGALAIDLTVAGTQEAPELEGQALLSEGRLGLPALGRTFGDVHVPLTFERNLIRIGAARAGTGRNGELRATGTIELRELSIGELDVALEMDDFRVIDTPTYRDLRLTATAADRLRFEGTTEMPRLSGALTLASGSIYLTEELTGPELEEVELTPAQVQRVEATFGVRIAEADTARSALFENLALALEVDIQRNVWLRSRTNPVLDIEFLGAVEAQKEPGGDIQLFRSIEVNRGNVKLYGRTFDITQGTLTFNGPIPETLVDLEAAFRVPARQGPGTQATITVAFTGRLAENPELTLGSDPPMENADIACYLAAGSPCGEAFQGGGGGIEGLAVGQLGALVEGVAAHSLGLDVAEVQQRPDGTIVVTFGAYVTSRTFASISQVVVEGQQRKSEELSRLPEVTVERELLDWLLLRLERRNIGGVGGSGVVEFSY